MKDPSSILRQQIYNLLSGNVYYSSSNIPVYDEKVPTNASPGAYYIILGSQTLNNSSNKTKFVHEASLTIDVVTEFVNDVQKLPADTICNAIMGILQTSPDAFPLTDTAAFGFRAFRYEDINTLSDQFDTAHVIRKIIRYNVIIQEN